MTNIETLLKKYYKADGKNMTGSNRKTPGERYHTQYQTKQKTQAKLKHRHNILTTLLKETPFQINKAQETEIRYWIDKFNNNFKTFHRQSSNETIILAFIMIQYKNVKTNLQVEEYRICKKYELDTPTFTLIQNRLIFELMRTTPLTYNQSKYINHEILEKGEQT